MSKKILTGILIAVLSLALTVPAFAGDGWDDPIQGKDGLYVTYQADGKWASNIAGELDDALANIQPGDTVQFKVAMNNEYAGDTYWYLENEIVETLEENSKASDGAYTYSLTYTNPKGTSVDLRNLVVGGDNENGLKDATDGLEDYVYLDKFAKGDKGYVTLEVKLDGESQGNIYWDTEGQLQILFAVEKLDTPKTPSKTPNTGDQTNILPYMIAMVAAGIGILVLAIVMVSKKKNRKAGE